MGRISKWGDAMMRTALYEAAQVLLTRVKRWSALKAWARRCRDAAAIRRQSWRWRGASASSCIVSGRWHRLPLGHATRRGCGLMSFGQALP